MTTYAGAERRSRRRRRRRRRNCGCSSQCPDQP
jgi:hypothetical protein